MRATPKHEWHRSFGALAAGLTIFLLSALGASAASAQTPAPNSYFLDWAPGNHTHSTNGLQVEGLGSIGCSYSLASIEQATVYDLNTLRQATITEFSPQSACGSIAQYESYIDLLVNYVEANSPTYAPRLWGGVLLDEEPGFGFSYTSLVALNGYVNSRMASTPGVSYWYENQGNCSGCWTQAQYDTLTVSSSYGGLPAPQVYNNFMRDQANSSGFNYQLVNCWSGAPYPYDVGCSSGYYPYNNGSYAASSITGSPYNQQFNTTNSFLWENVFQP